MRLALQAADGRQIWEGCVLAATHGLAIVEDNAHAFGGTWRGHPIGTTGTMGTLGFRDSKTCIAVR